MEARVAFLIASVIKSIDIYMVMSNGQLEKARVKIEIELEIEALNYDIILGTDLLQQFKFRTDF